MKKGFTIIELLAIIVILAIVALITVPVIRNLISKSKRTAAIDEAYVYIDAVESNSGLGALDPNYIKLDDTCYDVTDSVFNNLKIKGKKPEAGQVCMNKHRVESAILFVDGFKVTVRNGQVISAVKGSESDSDLTILYNKVDVGDYVTMTPNPDASKTYTSLTKKSNGYVLIASQIGVSPQSQSILDNNPIDPSELTVWRVIKKNSDNTIDLVSEYSSSSRLLFMATSDAAYKNYIGVLNEVASLYENSAFTTKSRTVGYKEGCQTEYITSLTYENESTGAGDEGCYTDDTEAIYNAVGSYATTVAHTGTKAQYYIASREYDSDNNKQLIRYVKDIPADVRLQNNAYNVRPIITVNGSLMGIEGRGTKQKPFKLES